MANTNVNYTVDAAGNLTSDGLRTFEYDEANRMAKVKVFKDGEEATVRYLHNALGQRVFQGEPTASQTLPNQQNLGQGFIDWLKSQFGWLFQQQATTSIGTAFVYADGHLPSWAVLGDYDNGSASGAGRSEYIWLPTQDGNAIPMGLFRNGRLFAIHTDHLGTPRLMTNDVNKPVWQWPYSAFGTTEPTGVLKATDRPKNAITNQPVMLKSTQPAQRLDLRYPGQMKDVESGTLQIFWRSLDAQNGRYMQADPLGRAGGLNVFIYAENSPLRFTDALGLQSAVPGPYGVPVPIYPIPGVNSPAPPPAGWDPTDGPAPGTGGEIIWPPGFSPDPPKPDQCYVEQPPPERKIPPKPDCEQQLKSCMAIARAQKSILLSGGCIVGYAICKKVFQ